MFNKNEIGLDYDNKETGKQAIKILRILGIKGKYRNSSSHRGYHIRIKVKDCNRKMNLKIRYMLGDCYGRYMRDVRRLQHGLKEFDILFDHKDNKTSGKWRQLK